jgi:hypothetical protein
MRVNCLDAISIVRGDDNDGGPGPNPDIIRLRIVRGFHVI